jgi:hypothetical protein
VICTVVKIRDVQELMLIVTGVPRDRNAHGVADGSAAPACLPWRGEDAPLGDARSALLARLGRADLAGLPAAALIARTPMVAGRNAPVGQTPWLLSPLHCVAGLDRLHLAPEGVLDLPAEQWAALCASFAQDLGASDLTLTPLDGSTALLQGAIWGDLVTTEPVELLGSDLRICQPRGAGAARWRRLQGEIEMWLHEHPVNRLRARAGQPPVTTLWLWGGATVAVAAASSASTPVQGAGANGSVLVGFGAWGRALAALEPAVRVVEDSPSLDFATLAAAHPDRSFAVCVSAAADAGEVERRWLLPAVQRFDRGGLDAVMLRHRDRLWRLERRRWWRRRGRDRTLADLLAAAPPAQEHG